MKIWKYLGGRVAYKCGKKIIVQKLALSFAQKPASKELTTGKAGMANRATQHDFLCVRVCWFGAVKMYLLHSEIVFLETGLMNQG